MLQSSWLSPFQRTILTKHATAKNQLDIHCLQILKQVGEQKYNKADKRKSRSVKSTFKIKRLCHHQSVERFDIPRYNIYLRQEERTVRSFFTQFTPLGQYCINLYLSFNQVIIKRFRHSPMLRLKIVIERTKWSCPHPIGILISTVRQFGQQGQLKSDNIQKTKHMIQLGKEITFETMPIGSFDQILRDLFQFRFDVRHSFLLQELKLTAIFIDSSSNRDLQIARFAIKNFYLQEEKCDLIYRSKKVGQVRTQCAVKISDFSKKKIVKKQSYRKNMTNYSMF